MTVNSELRIGNINPLVQFSTDWRVEAVKNIIPNGIVNAITSTTQPEFKEKTTIYLMLGIIALLIFILFVLLKKNRKLKDENRKINIINESKQAFLDANRNIIFMKDENLKYVFTNKEFNKVYNKVSSQIIGRDDFELNEKLANLYRSADLEVLNNKVTIVKESKYKDRIHRTTKFPVKLLNGHYGVGGHVEDVTEEYNNKRKLQEMNDMLNKTNNLLLAIFESSPDVIIFALDKNYRYLSFNQKYKKRIYELWHEEIKRGMSALEFIDNQDQYIKTKEKYDRALAGESFSVVEEYGKGLCKQVWQNYYSPVYSNNNEIIGLTCFSLNITDRINAEEEIIYLSYHDSLTGLYNRRFLTEKLPKLDLKSNLPISIIVGDMNGLKLVNDIFGHDSGDLFIKKVANALKKICRKDDIIARVGGDEFIILLPKTKSEEAQNIIFRIKREVSKESVNSIRGSISLGYDTKTHEDEDILQVLKTAEDRMYSIKAIEENELKSTTIAAIIETLHKDSPVEEKHSVNVSEMCINIGKAMGLSEVDIRRLREAAYLHDIGKIALSEKLLNRNGKLTSEEKKVMKKHAVIGYRILNCFDETIDLAEIILAHHERWDGSGYPKGLKGEEIPILSRIISVVENYDFMINRKAMNKEKAIEEIKTQAGSKFDPEIADIFINKILLEANNSC